MTRWLLGVAGAIVGTLVAHRAYDNARALRELRRAHDDFRAAIRARHALEELGVAIPIHFTPADVRRLHELELERRARDTERSSSDSQVEVEG